jgi:CDP-diacylglycerol---serine O-phosphatidyltransferase
MQPTTKWYGFIPNFITTLNLASGSIAIYFALNNQLKTAAILMVCAAIFDFFDGFVARLLKVSGELGKELDSLADVISFGLLPGALVFSLLRMLLLGEAPMNEAPMWKTALLLSSLVVPALSALRLAKFNLDTRQKTGFIGLPTPANALFWAAASWIITDHTERFTTSPLLMAFVLVAISLLLSLLLVSELPMFALKFTGFGWKGNQVKYLFLLASAGCIALLGVGGIALCIALYIFTSLGLALAKKQ